MCTMCFKEIAHLKLSDHLLTIVMIESLGRSLCPLKYFQSFTARHIDKDSFLSFQPQINVSIKNCPSLVLLLVLTKLVCVRL